MLHHLQASITKLQTSINVHKLLRYTLREPQLTVEAEVARALQLVQEYLAALSLGIELPKTELQPADDLAILGAQVFVSLYKQTSDEAYLHTAVTVLEFASAGSPQSYQIHLQLVRIYRLLGAYIPLNQAISGFNMAAGAPQPALEHYRLLNVKQIQNDTLSHYILSRASTFSLAASGDLTYASECLEASQIYMSNSQEVKKGNLELSAQSANVRQTADYVVRAFNAETYSQVSLMLAF